MSEVDTILDDTVEDVDFDLLLGDMERMVFLPDCKSGADSCGEGNELVTGDNTEQVQLTPELRDKIIERVEFYFSNEYLMRNSFLTKHIKRNREGYVSITLITSFKKVKCLTRDWHLVAEALRHSTQLEVNKEGRKVKRKDPLPEYLKVAAENKGRKIVIAHNIPAELNSMGSLSNIFSDYGEILSVKFIRPNDMISEDLKAAKVYHSQIGKEICVVVEFEKPEHALRCVEEMNKSDEIDIKVSLLNLKVKQSQVDVVKEKEATIKGESDSQSDKEKKSKRKKKKNKRLDELRNLGDDVSTCSSDDAEAGPRQRNSPISVGKGSGKGNLNSKRAHPFGSPRGGSPRSSSDSWKRNDYNSDSSVQSPWSRRPLRSDNSPRASPLPPRRSFSRPNKNQMEGVIRQPVGPDGTRGFTLGRGTRPVIN